MKQLFMFAIAIMSIMFAACNDDIESKAKSYIDDQHKAFKTGSIKKIEKIEAEFSEWKKSLSKEDQEKVDDVIWNYSPKD